jgi:pseudaminic acid biosynthesis-associated methylase
MTEQLDTWRGTFGREYTERNIVDWRSRLPAFREALESLRIDHVLEVGCNRGHNLVAISELCGPETRVVGVEPATYAARIARSETGLKRILLGQALALPFSDHVFDLVFTAGVLIHIPLSQLPSALAEIYRVSRRYILAVEYFAEKETVIAYRGHTDLLWKRNFKEHFESLFPHLHPVRSGHWNRSDGFDQTTWWLFEKPQNTDGLEAAHI